MEGQSDFDAFVPANLAVIGIEADEVELAVMRAVHDNWWPAVELLLAADLSGVEPEPQIDLAQPPGR